VLGFKAMVVRDIVQKYFTKKKFNTANFEDFECLVVLMSG
jgi:hypothetical protein